MKFMYVVTISLSFIIINSCSMEAGSYRCIRIGDFDFVDGDGCYSGMGMRIGESYFYDDNQ